MKAILRNYPGYLDSFDTYDSVSSTSYNTVEEAIKGEERQDDLIRVITLIPNEREEQFYKYLWDNRTISMQKVYELLGSPNECTNKV